MPGVNFSYCSCFLECIQVFNRVYYWQWETSFGLMVLCTGIVWLLHFPSFRKYLNKVSNLTAAIFYLGIWCFSRLLNPYTNFYQYVFSHHWYLHGKGARVVRLESNFIYNQRPLWDITPVVLPGRNLTWWNIRILFVGLRLTVATEPHCKQEHLICTFLALPWKASHS